MRDFCLYAGSLFYFMSMFTGDQAADHIKSTFCYLGEIYRHEQTAEYGLIALIVTLLCDLASRLLTNEMGKKVAGHLVTLCCLVVLYWVVETSHQGAMLVYERGAAVKTSLEKCE